MNNIIIFFSWFYILLLSVIGYGVLFQKIFYKNFKGLNNDDTSFVGFNGLFSLTFISILTSLFVPHNFTHNIIFHLIGLLALILIKFKNKNEYLISIFIISILVISAVLISKTHDDFSYYHLPFTKYLTEHKVIFGMSNIEHGYKLLSSLFFLNSLFYLPFIDYFAFHFSSIYFLIFFNFFLIKEIFFRKNHEIINFLYLFALIFFNLSFNRIAEFGTDKAGQILIVILSIKILHITCYNDNKKEFNDYLILLPLISFCISLKTYFLPYTLLGVLLIFFKKKIYINFKVITFSNFFWLSIFFLIIYFLHHFISTGCLISPISQTCFGDYLKWAPTENSFNRLSIWLEQWAKAGAGPDFRVENPLLYIQKFNWLSRWYENYFIGKFSDQLLLISFIFITIFLFTKKLRLKSKSLGINKEYLVFCFIIFLIFFIWFFKHPQLRYGGYAIVFLIISIIFSNFYFKFTNKVNNKKNIRNLLILTVIIFNFKNFTRINNEFNRTDYYRFDNFPFYSIYDKKFIQEKHSTGLTIYKTNGHCWNVPSPCLGKLTKKLSVKKINGYYFLYKN